jgi:hypothetical protein
MPFFGVVAYPMSGVNGRKKRIYRYTAHKMFIRKKTHIPSGKIEKNLVQTALGTFFEILSILSNL